MTYREFLNNVISILSVAPAATNSTPLAENSSTAILAAELVSYAKSEVEKLDIKNYKRKSTLTKEQQYNENFKEEILLYMKDETIYTASELAIYFGVSTQKISALCKQLAEKKLVEVIDGYKPEGSKSKVKGYKKAE